MIEKKIYTQYAFTKNEEEKSEMNYSIYKELKERYKILKLSDIKHIKPTEEQLKENDVVYSREACYYRGEYRIYKSPDEMSLDELALICDQGNLCFGYSGDKSFITVWED